MGDAARGGVLQTTAAPGHRVRSDRPQDHLGTGAAGEHAGHFGAIALGVSYSIYRQACCGEAMSVTRTASPFWNPNRGDFPIPLTHGFNPNLWDRDPHTQQPFLEDDFMSNHVKYCNDCGLCFTDTGDTKSCTTCHESKALTVPLHEWKSMYNRWMIPIQQPTMPHVPLQPASIGPQPARPSMSRQPASIGSLPVLPPQPSMSRQPASIGSWNARQPAYISQPTFPSMSLQPASIGSRTGLPSTSRQPASIGSWNGLQPQPSMPRQP